MSREFETWLSQMGIRHELSAPYCPKQNGVSERAIRTIMEAARSMYLARSVADYLWAEAVAYAVYIQNRMLSSTGSTTPYETLHGEKPNISHLCIFGSTSFVHIPDAMRRKLEPKTIQGIFVGCCPSTKAYRIWLPCKRRVEISRNVIVDESNGLLHEEKQNKTSTPFDMIFTTENLEDNIQHMDAITTTSGEPDETTRAITGTEEENQAEEMASTEAETAEQPISNEETCPAETLTDRNQDATTSTSPARRKSSRVPVFNEKFLEWRRSILKPMQNQENKHSSSGMGAILTLPIENLEPKNYKEAMESQEASLWTMAIEDEYKSLISNQTWVLVKRPIERNVIGCKWVFKVKPGYSGVSERYKARLVAKGFSQNYGTDYSETFAPVLKHDSLRTILAITAYRDLEITLLDVKTAFRYGTLKEQVFMEQPDGFIVAGKEDHVCLLEKSLYGLKQAPRVWNEKFNLFLVKFGLSRCESDSCVYHCQKGEDLLVVAIFVDDGLVCGTSSSSIQLVIEFLSKEFDMRCLPATRFLGLDIHRDRESRSILINQPEFIKKILCRFNMATCNPTTIPADPYT